MGLKLTLQHNADCFTVNSVRTHLKQNFCNRLHNIKFIGMYAHNYEHLPTNIIHWSGINYFPNITHFDFTFAVFSTRRVI